MSTIASGPTSVEPTSDSLVQRVLRLRPLQFLLVLPTLVVVVVVTLSAVVGMEHPSVNFGAVFTWVVWWGTLLGSVMLAGRAWCLVCPLGALGEWTQRLSLWWRSRAGAGLGLRWPRALSGLWLPTVMFVIFVFLDSGYGVSASPRLTAGLIVTLALAAMWVNLFFERRAFCRHVCPLTAFLGVGALASMVELRCRDTQRCASDCSTKDCFRGNQRSWGCPMGEFPGGGLDTNLLCILCTECLTSCPKTNLSVRFRLPGHDLWAMRRPRVDVAFAASVIAGLATVVPLITVAFLPALRASLAAILPNGVPPNDLPRLAAVGLLLVVGVLATVGLVWGASAIARPAVGDGTMRTRVLFARFGGALVPIAIAKLGADLLDHVLRTWGALTDVTRALLLDFPLNRVMGSGRATVVHLLTPVQVYHLQTAVLLGGLVLSLHVSRRIAVRTGGSSDTALAAFVPMAAVAVVLTLASLWALGIGL
jgi:polyferredoxin